MHQHVSSLIIPAAVWVHTWCWGRTEGSQGYLPTPPIFQFPCLSLKTWGLGRALIHPICYLETTHPPFKKKTKQTKTPLLSLCLSVSGTVMLILGFILPQKLRGLHLLTTKHFYPNLPPTHTWTFPNMWHTDDRETTCLLSHHRGYNLRLFMNEQKFRAGLHM